MDSKVEYRFPLSFKRQSKLYFWSLFKEKLLISVLNEGAKQKLGEIFNQSLARLRIRSFIDVSKKNRKKLRIVILIGMFKFDGLPLKVWP